ISTEILLAGKTFGKRDGIIEFHTVWQNRLDGIDRQDPAGPPSHGTASPAASRSFAVADSPADPGFFSKSSEAELMQYRSPVGAGPSSNTWPRWAPHLRQVTSVRSIQ